MSGIAGIRHDYAPIQAQDSDSSLRLEAEVPLVIVGQGRRNILGRLIQSIVTSLGQTSLASIGVGLGSRPQRLIGCAHLPRHIARYLRWQLISLSDVIVARLL
jgi:hypothetical protein